MAQASASIDLPVRPEEVWRLIGGFDSLPAWTPFVTESELSEGGRVRRLATTSGEIVVERLLTFDEAGRSYSYTFVGEPFPVSGYRSTLSVQAADGGARSHVDWRGEFTPAGITDAEATRLFQGIYDDGLAALAKRFAS